MPFDPDAYLASKSAFDPDAYLASKGSPTPIPAPAAPKEPEDKRGFGQRALDLYRIPTDIAASAASSMVAAPIADVAGMARTGWEALTGGSKGDGDAGARTREGVRDALTYHPNNPTLNNAMRVPGQAASYVSDMGGRVADAARGDAPGNSFRGAAVNATVEGLKQAPNFLGLGAARAVPKVAGAVERAGDTLMGTTAKAAKGEAMTATRGALGDVDAGLARQQAAKGAEADQFADTAVRTQRTLDAARERGVPTTEALGGQVRDDYLKVMSDAKAAREKAVEPLYVKARAAAAAREAQGQFIDVKPAVTDLDKMIAESEHLPDLHAKLLKLRQSVEGVAPKGVGAPAPKSIVDVNGKPLTAPIKPDAPRLPYAELDNSVRYIKDIAFSGEAEGYGALIRNTAKRLSMKLDEQIAKSVPEHAAATAKYRELSEPMETLATRIGGVLHDTEGGLKGDAYAKVPTQDIPARVFGKKDRIEQLIDALAGGKGAPTAARAAAQAKVDTWVENWILDKTTATVDAPGKVGADAARVIGTPDMRATLNAVPGARDRLTGLFGREAAQQRAVPELNKASEASRAEMANIAKQRVAVKSQIEQADIDLAHGSQKAAYDGYVSALRKSMGASHPDKYRAAIALIERAGTLEDKTAKARKLAWAVGGAAGVAGAASIGVQLPGVFK